VNRKTFFLSLYASVGSLVLLGIGLINPSAISQDTAEPAKSLAHSVQEHYRRAQTLHAVFLERYSEGPKQARIESGTVYFKRPGRMRWEYESPEKKLFLVDGKTVWFYVPYDHTVTKAPVKESSDWRTPLALLTGKADLSRMCSRIDLSKEGTIPAGHSLLRCLPKGQPKPKLPPGSQESDQLSDLPGAGDFTEVLLEADTATGELARIEIRQPAGIDLEYRFGNWEENVPLPDSMFQFKVPDGLAIVDGAELVKKSR
jgi:outer membrane lipoprotein carrier protein